MTQIRRVLSTPVGSYAPSPEVAERFGDGAVLVHVYAVVGGGYVFQVAGESSRAAGVPLMGRASGEPFATAEDAVAAGLDLPDYEGDCDGPGYDVDEFDCEMVDS